MCIIMSMIIIIINQFKRPNTRVLHPVESSASSIATTPRTVEAKPCIGVLVTEAFFCVCFFFHWLLFSYCMNSLLSFFVFVLMVLMSRLGNGSLYADVALAGTTAICVLLESAVSIGWKDASEGSDSEIYTYNVSCHALGSLQHASCRL